MPYRIQRFSSTLKHSLGEILLNELSNPEFRFISISEVSLSNDLKKARVFISSPNDNIDEILIQLKKAKGFIKKLLPEKMKLKYIPELEFQVDVGFKIDQQISKIKKEIK
ncbi:MAG: 30S ribosome-binding factor RbfA [Candidatus Aminicenantes bacterium]|nr:30S ribosome-binding factor RbfA [Candidatus Aminicenantes bacterium]